MNYFNCAALKVGTCESFFFVRIESNRPSDSFSNRIFESNRPYTKQAVTQSAGHRYVIIIIIIIITSLFTPDRPQAGIQRHHTGMRGAPVGCQPQGPACRQSTANTAPVVHLSQPKLVPTLLLGGQGYMCVNYLPKVVTRYASVGDRTRDLPIASRER